MPGRASGWSRRSPCATGSPQSLRRCRAVAEIEWTEAADYTVRIHTPERTYTTRETLSGIAEQLDPRVFVRVHRSTIVNIDRVREVQPYFHGAYILVLQDGTEIRLSRARRRAFEEALC